MIRRPQDIPEERPRRRRRRTATVAEVVDFLEYLSPPSLSSPEEPYGLEVGAQTAEVKTIVVAPMASFTALSTAAARKSTMLVTSAPIITRPLMAVRRDDPTGSKVAYLVEHRISHYTLANSIAAAPGGLDETLADRLGLAATTAIMPTTVEPLYKINIYAPSDYAEAVMMAAAEAGAGHVGNYSHCSFQAEGRGTFLPCDGAHPTVGSVGKLESVDETRIEMVVPQREMQGVIAAVLEVHPYEEVAYDVITLRNPGVMFGRGRIGELPLKVSLETVLAQVQDALEVDSIRCSHQPDFPIGTLAVASGLCEGVFWHANRSGAGALVTGGVTQQDLMHAESSTTVVIDIGYAASVRPGLERLSVQLHDTFAVDGVEVLYSA